MGKRGKRKQRPADRQRREAARAAASAAQLHALALQREIQAVDRAHRRLYLREYHQAFPQYRAALPVDALRQRLAEADILLVADYHTLPACQQFTADLLAEAREQGREVVLCLEMVFSSLQPVLDDWMEGYLSEAELRRGILFDSEWGYAWPPYRALLKSAKQHCRAIYGIDSEPRNDLHRIAQRDLRAASKLEEVRRLHPGALLVVLFGESHLAPQHLPQRVREEIPQARVLTLLQNVDDLYWHALNHEPVMPQLVDVSDDVMCAFTASPVQKYQSYKAYIDELMQ